MMKKFYSVLLLIMIITLSSFRPQKKEASFSIPFVKYSLSNGLTVILHEDHSDPIVAVAIYYHVGSSRETAGKTGFAHLFEHMMFQESENLGRGQFVNNVSNAGGSFNGSTGHDVTNYFEVVPKNALEMVLWMESDRMGYLENTVTKTSLANQQNVVQNEKRQGVDNAPYGFNEYLILKNLYPKSHPYNWEVIGNMQDLTNATVEDVRAFHSKFYTPGNAVLVIAGDVTGETVKPLIEKYFGEIRSGNKIEKRAPMPVTLPATVRLFHEDNFAKAPQLTMVFPAAEQFSKDSYALDFLEDLLANSKKSPLYTILVKDKKLTSRVMARNRSEELAGSFRITVTANPGVNLTDVEKALFEGFGKFEKDWFSEEDLTRIKAGYETQFYNDFSSDLSKAFNLAQYTVFTGDPQFYKKDFAGYQSVTMADVKSVFEKYIKGKKFIETSFVPKGETNLIVEGSEKDGIVEEDVTKAAEVKAAPVAEEPVIKTHCSFDRSVMPAIGPDPEVTIPAPWSASLPDGLKIWGITQRELPLIQYSITLDGGHLLDTPEKAGVASLVAAMMNEGTKNKTPEQLEDAIGMLGASIRVSSGNENITINVSTLARNFDKSIGLVEEMLLEPRWDEEQFSLVKSRTINIIKRNAASPDYLASSTLNRLMFGDNILAVDASGTEASVEAITIDDLKDFYGRYFSPSVARLVIAGDIDRPGTESALKDLNMKWPAKKVSLPEITIPAPPATSQIYFVDVPGAKQSVISIGAPSIARTNPDYYAALVANYKLGAREASISGLWMQIIREQKGFTYGAYSSFAGFKNYGYFSASSRVRTNSTLESVVIFRTEMEKYRQEMPPEYIEFTRSGLMKSNARRFETLNSLIGYLNTMSSYNLPTDYIKQEEAYLKGLTPARQLEIAKKYIDPGRMYYVVAGDARTQLKELEKAGLGEPVLIK
jgi:zinc protease